MVHKPYIFLFRIPFFLTLEYLEFSEKFSKTVLRPRFLLRKRYLCIEAKYNCLDDLNAPDFAFEPTFFLSKPSLLGAFTFWA
ncbi:hypothetical protein QL285_022185 [Trifolium repens]|nr:hypothetical protein QL285_022185 [Trifolium repens]